VTIRYFLISELKNSVIKKLFGKKKLESINISEKIKNFEKF